MYIRNKNVAGRLLYYKILDDNKTVEITIETTEGKKVDFTCRESQISIPCVLGNSKILYDILNNPESDFQIK